MEEGEEQEPDRVTTAEVFDLIGDVHGIHEELKDVEVLKHKLKYSKNLVAYAEKKCENYQDLVRKSDAENYELKKSKVTLDQHNALQKELTDLKAEHHDLVNWAEIRYQTVNKELITATKRYDALEKENDELIKKNPASDGQVLQLTKPTHAKTKKSKEVQLQRENGPKESLKLADLEEILNTERNQIKELTSKLNALQEHYNEILVLNDQLQKEIKENNNKHQTAIDTLNDQITNKDAEIKNLIQEMNLPKEDPVVINCSTIPAETCTADDMPMVFDELTDYSKPEKNKEIKIQLQPKNSLGESQKLIDLKRVLNTKHKEIKELTSKLNALQEHQRSDKKALNDRVQNEKRANGKHQQTIDILNNQLRHKNTEIEKLVEELNALRLEINLLKEDTALVNRNSNFDMSIDIELNHNNKTQMPNIRPQMEDIDRGDTSDPPTDEINSILNEMRRPFKLISPLPFESVTEPTRTKNMQIQEPKQMNDENLKASIFTVNRKLNMKLKELNVTNRRLYVSKRKLTMAKKECCLQHREFIVTKKELHMIQNELRSSKKKLRMVKCYSSLKRSNPKCNRVYRDQGTQCSNENNKKEDVSIQEPPPLITAHPPQPDITEIPKKVFAQQMKIRKGLKQQLLDDIRKWHTDSYLSYPSAESDVESGLSQSTLRRKKFTKQRQKQITDNYSDEEDIASNKENVQKKKTKLQQNSAKTTPVLNLNNAELDVRPEDRIDQDIYAKAQGSVDSGYVKTDSGSESEVQTKKRKTSPNQNETCKKQKCLSSKVSKIQEVPPQSPAEVKHWTRSMVKLFGTDSESYSSCFEGKPQKVVAKPMRKPKAKYLQRVECERSLRSTESSDSDFLKGFANGCYSSISKNSVLGLSPLNIVAATKASTPKIVQKQRQVTRQKQEPSSIELNINLLLNDLNLSEGYSTTTDTDAKTRNPLLDDATQSLTCRVISKPPSANRRSPSKAKPIPPPTKMVLRSASKKTDDESDYSKIKCKKRISHIKSSNTSPKVLEMDVEKPTINLRSFSQNEKQHITPQPILKSTILPDLNLTCNTNPKFIKQDQLTRASKVITLEPNVPNSKSATSKSPDLPAPGSFTLSSPDFLDFESPVSPKPDHYENQNLLDVEPKTIPLEAQGGTNSAKSILNQLLHYCKSGGMAQEVTNALLCENPHFIAKLILEVVSQDIHAKIEIFNYRRAPLLTTTQRTMLGLLLDLEDKGLKGVTNNFLALSEQHLITLKDPVHISPTARMHAAICKMQFDYKRMRLMLCKAVFFMGDAAIPYLYIVLCSWLELIPLNNDNLSGHDALETRTLVQLIRLKRCTQPENNLHNLQALLNKYHGYTFDREDSEKLLEDLFKCYIEKNRTVLEDATSEAIMYLTIALCESLDKNVVFTQLDKLKMRLVVITNDNQMYGIIYLVGIITSQYCEDSDVCANVTENKDWLQQFCADSYPEYVTNAAKDVLRKF